MIYSRHYTAEAAYHAATRHRKDDPINNFYVICAAKGPYLYAVIKPDREEI